MLEVEPAASNQTDAFALAPAAEPGAVAERTDSRFLIRADSSEPKLLSRMDRDGDLSSGATDAS